MDLNSENFLLRGCNLKLTDYIIGIVIYNGHQTKIMKNSPISRIKISRVEEIMNYQIIATFLFQIFLSTLASIFKIFLKLKKNVK